MMHIVNIEKVLTNNRLAVAADIAVLRGVLISAERGVMPSGMVFSGKMTSRKMRDAVAADVLRKADETISASIKEPVAQIAEGEPQMSSLLYYHIPSRHFSRTIPLRNSNTFTPLYAVPIIPLKQTSNSHKVKICTHHP